MSLFRVNGRFKNSLAWLLSIFLLIPLVLPAPVLADNGDPEPPITVNLRATGFAGDVFNISDFEITAGEITIGGHTLDRHTVMGAVAAYVYAEGINFEITESDWGLYVCQIGDNEADENSWMYYVDESSPWAGADQYYLDNGDAVHFANNSLGLYSLSLSLDKADIVLGESITATVEYTDGNGYTVPAAEAHVYVSNEVDDFGNPVVPGTSVGQTEGSGELSFTWDEAGNFYPYAEWNSKSTQYQRPVVSFSVPGIYSTTQLSTGDINPTVEVNIIGGKFVAGVAVPGNWEIDTGTSGLTVNTITKDIDHKVTISFTGTATAGTISIRAKAAALDRDADSNELLIPIVKNITVPQLDNDWVKNGNTVLDALLKYQQADGSFWWQEDTPGAIKGSTAQSLAALVDLAYSESTKHRMGNAVQFDPKPEKLANAILKTVQWYQDNHPSPQNWEGLPALWNAGENLNVAPWLATQDWRETDPGFAADAAGNEHVHHIYRLLSVGLDPASIWDNRDLFAELAAQQQENGSFGELGRHIWAIVALDVGNWHGASREDAVNHLLEQQNEDGSFGAFGQLDYTGWSLIALSNYMEGAGVDVDDAINDALTFLQGRQQNNGGFSLPGEWGAENANTNAAVISGLVAVDEDLAIGESAIPVDETPLSITIPQGAASSRLNASTTTEGDKETATLPSIEVEATTPLGIARLDIFQDTKVSGPGNWTGSIKLPELLDSSSVNVSGGNVSAVIEVGFPDGQLDFDKPVRLTIPGQAGKSVGFTSAGAPLTEITKTLSEDSEATASAELSSGEAGKIDDNNDLVIWTTHFTKFVAYNPETASNGSSPGNGGGSDPSTITVSVQVIGKNGTHFAGNVTLPTNRANALEALKETGVPFSTREDEAYIYEIGGEREELTTTAGWKYKVNGVVPAVPAKSYDISSGDQVIWFWAANTDVIGPGAGASPQMPTALTAQETEKLQEIITTARKQLVSLIQKGWKTMPLEEVLEQITVIGDDMPMSLEEKEALREQLAGNIVSIAITVDPEENILISERAGEILLQVNAGSLTAVTEITVEEISADSLPAAQTHVPVSPAYRLEPKGTAFSKPVLFSIRLAIPDDIDPAELVLAWLDEDDEQWYALPAVVDISNGYISAFLDHFTPFAILAREKEPEPGDVLPIFDDVTPESFPWAYEAVSYLARLGIVNGVGDGKFAPTRVVTRAEFAAMLVNALDLDAGDVSGTGDKAGSPFTDVKAGSWYYDPVITATKGGIVKGTTETTFHPDEIISREEMAVMLSRVESSATTENKTDISFSDAEAISPWAQYSVTRAVSHGLIKGFPDGSFQPWGTTTRAQAAVVLYRLLME